MWTATCSPLPFFQTFDPTARHAPDFIQFGDDKKQLLLRNELSSMNHAPQDPEFFEQEVQLVQGVLFDCEGADGAEGSVYGTLQSRQRVVDDPLGESKAVGFGEVGGTAEGPGKKFFQESQNRRAGGRGHGAFTLSQVASVDNLLLAARKAKRGKSRKPDVEDFFHRLESNVMALHESLSGGEWRPGGYRHFEIREPKRRLISAAPFADRVVHHALCNLLAPRLERRFHPHSFSCQLGKGTTAAREQCRKMVNRHFYVLKCDVRKFFDSIHHETLLGFLEQEVACPGVQSLIRHIVFSHEVTPGCGLPIGNLTSQLWGNYLLDPLDHWITQQPGVAGYARYTDDFLIFGADKKRLHGLRTEIEERLASLRLRFAEPKSRLMKCTEGIPFCGFRFQPGLRPRVLGATKRRFEARRSSMKQRGEPMASISKSIFAWYQFSREGNTEGLRRAYCRWPLCGHRQRRRCGEADRVLRGGSWNNNDRDNLASSNRNNNTPDNRNNNNGFRCVVVVGGASPKSETKTGPVGGGNFLPPQCQEVRLTHTPGPCDKTPCGKWPPASAREKTPCPPAVPHDGTAGVFP